MAGVVLSGIILPLQGFLSKPVSFPQAAQVDRLSIGNILPGHIDLVEKTEWRREKNRSKVRRENTDKKYTDEKRSVGGG